jgi:hypothetical protein
MDYRVTRIIQPIPKQKRSKPQTVGVQTKCPCGKTIKANIRVPTRFSPSNHKLSCASCDSIFELRSKCVPGSEKIDSHFIIIHLSEVACRRLRGEVADGES